MCFKFRNIENIINHYFLLTRNKKYLQKGYISNEIEKLLQLSNEKR